MHGQATVRHFRCTPRTETQTPPIATFFETWQLDPVALAVIVIAALLYGAAVVSLARRGERWPVLPTIGFYLLGLGSFAIIEFGFLGAHSIDLRWAFTTRIALLLFAVPGLVSLGLPITLAKRALSGMPLRVMDAVLRSWLVRLFGNAVFAPLLALAAFTVFLTPLAGSIREAPLGQALITVLVPTVGLLMVLPIIEHTTQRTSFFITVEFLLVFVELVLGALPAWFPSSYHDQHLSGDLLWFIAEVADVPVLILLFIRWSRTDRTEAKQLDALSDEEMDALTQEHLRSHRQ